jgi:two-component system, cell cycle sensor histidine kinase and response regulator CckA
MAMDEQQPGRAVAESRFRTLFLKSPDAFMLLIDGVFTDCNEATLALFDARRDEFVGKTPYDFSPPYQPNGATSKMAATDRIRTALRTGSAKFEWVHCRLDRSEFWAEVTLTAFTHEGRQTLFAAVRDLSVRKRAEQALKESEERYRKLFDLSPQGIVIAGTATRRMVYANPAFRTLFGYDEAALCALSVDDLHPPEEMPEVDRHFQRMTAGEETFAPELTCRRADGSVFCADISAAVIELNGERLVLGTFQDNTERRKNEEQKLEMERRLLHAQKLESLGVLAGGIAHDFNNLLTAILGNLDLALREIPKSSPTRSKLDRAIQATNSAAELTRQMLAYSGKGRFVLELVDLNEVMRDNADLLRASIVRTATLDVDTAPDLPLIEADPGQIQQVIMNLVTNASEALGSEAGVIAIRTGVEESDEARLARSRLEGKPGPGRFVFVEVSDTGAGMGAEAERRLFEPFFTTKFTGRGLGMSVVSGIVRGHGGAIFVDSRPAEGTMVRVLFPASETTRRERTGDDAASADFEMRGLKILVVDDEEPIRNVCAAFAERLGLIAVTASDGLEGLAILRALGSEIACVILDLTMPRMDGVRAFQEMKRISPDVPIILSSGYDEQHATSLFGGEGLAGFIEKPFRMRAFEEKLKKVLRGRS